MTMPSINGVAIPESWGLPWPLVRFLCGSAASVRLAPPDAPPLREKPSQLLDGVFRVPIAAHVETAKLWLDDWNQIQAAIVLLEEVGATTFEIATRTGIEPRKVREVLEAQARAGKVERTTGGASRSFLWRLK